MSRPAGGVQLRVSVRPVRFQPMRMRAAGRREPTGTRSTRTRTLCRVPSTR